MKKLKINLKIVIYLKFKFNSKFCIIIKFFKLVIQHCHPIAKTHARHSIQF